MSLAAIPEVGSNTYQLILQRTAWPINYTSPLVFLPWPYVFSTLQNRALMAKAIDRTIEVELGVEEVWDVVGSCFDPRRHPRGLFKGSSNRYCNWNWNNVFTLSFNCVEYWVLTISSYLIHHFSCPPLQYSCNDLRVSNVYDATYGLSVTVLATKCGCQQGYRHIHWLCYWRNDGY